MQTGERWTFGTPHPAQEEALCSPQRFILFRGGLGSGKTFTGVMWAISNVLLHSDRTNGVIIAPTYTMLDDVIRPQIAEWWPRMVVNTYHGTERSFTFPNGSKVFLRSAERPGRLRGTEYGWAWIDEPAECKEEIFTVITGRLRAQTRAKHQVLLTGTPSGYNWVHEMFGEPHEKHAEGFHVVVAPTEDNAHNLPEGYIDSLRNLYSARLAEQELSGNVVLLEGVVFSEFDPPTHVIDCAWPDNAQTWAGVDFGYRNPAVVFFRRHPEHPGAWVAFDEIMPQDTTTEALADRINAKGYRLQEAWCDPAGKAATTAGRTDVEVLRRAGIPAKYRTSTKVRRIAFGLEVMRSAMAPADGSEPRFFVHKRLTQGSKRGLYKALLSYKYKGNTEAPDKDNVHDHAVDACRYHWANTDGISRRTVAQERRREPVQRVVERKIRL